MQAPTRLLTYEEYLELPFDGRRTELVDGAIVEMAEPTPLHDDISEALKERLNEHFAEAGLAYVTKERKHIQIPQPGKTNLGKGRSADLVVCTREQWKELRRINKSSFRIGSPPLIAIEILSKGTWRQDMNEKQAEYARASVPEYWRINPLEGQRWVEVLQFGEARMYKSLGVFRESEFIVSRVLPDLKLTSEQILEV